MLAGADRGKRDVSALPAITPRGGKEHADDDEEQDPVDDIKVRPVKVRCEPSVVPTFDRVDVIGTSHGQRWLGDEPLRSPGV